MRALRALSVCALLAAAACSDAFAYESEPFQGIVEHEDRVLGFQVAGRVSEVRATRGELVEQDAVLIRLDDSLERPQRAARAAEVEAATEQLRVLQAGARPRDVRAAQAELRAIKNQLALSRRTRSRQTRLVAGGALARATMDETDASISNLEGRRAVLEERIHTMLDGARPEDLSAAMAQLETAKAALDAIETRLSHYTLKSPAALHVTEVQALPGEMIGPGSPAVTVADLDHPFVDVFVPEARMSEVHIGQRAYVRVDGLLVSLEGKVEYVAHRTEFTPRFLFSKDERSNLVLRVRVRINDPKHQLRAGVPAFVVIEGLSPRPGPVGPR